MSFRVANDLIINLEDVSADSRSERLDITNVYGFSIHVVSTGTISAVLKIEVSNNGVDFVELLSPTLTVTNAVNLATSIPEFYYKYCRLFLDVASGTTNTVKVWFTSKGI